MTALAVPRPGDSGPTGPGRLRVSVTSATRRVDLVLPGTLPVAELIPELARSVGILDPGTVHGGYRLVLPDGRRLVPAMGLIGQGVEDGSVLTVVAGADDPPPRLYDDVAEAMADAVVAAVRPWRDVHGRAVALAASIALLLLGAAGLLAQSGSHRAGPVSAGIAVVLLGGAGALARVERQPGTAIAVAWLACLYAALAGALLAHDPGAAGLGPPGASLAGSGGAALVAGAVALVGVPATGRGLLLPAVVDGALLVAAGLVVHATGWPAAVVLSVMLVVVVSAAGFLPRLVVGLTTAGARRHRSDAKQSPVDAARMAADARMAHVLLTGISATIGVLLVVAVPFAVDLGLWGTLLAVASCTAVLLRTREHRAAGEVGVGLALGVAAMLVTGAAVLCLHPAWSPVTAAALSAGGALALVATTLRPGPSPRSGRAADLAEAAVLVLLVPLLVLASGVLPAMTI